MGTHHAPQQPPDQDAARRAQLLEALAVEQVRRGQPGRGESTFRPAPTAALATRAGVPPTVASVTLFRLAMQGLIYFVAGGWILDADYLQAVLDDLGVDVWDVPGHALLGGLRWRLTRAITDQDIICKSEPRCCPRNCTAGVKRSL